MNVTVWPDRSGMTIFTDDLTDAQVAFNAAAPDCDACGGLGVTAGAVCSCVDPTRLDDAAARPRHAHTPRVRCGSATGPAGRHLRLVSPPD